MTKKQHFNKIVNKALTINRHLEALRAECSKLIEDIDIHADEYDYDDYEYALRNLKYTLDDLQNFDLEDSIPNKATVEY